MSKRKTIGDENELDHATLFVFGEGGAKVKFRRRHTAFPSAVSLQPKPNRRGQAQLLGLRVTCELS